MLRVRVGIIGLRPSHHYTPERLTDILDQLDHRRRNVVEFRHIRFHGTKQWYRHDSTNQELATWVERSKASGATRVWAYFNNDRDAYAIRNAKAFSRLVKRS